MKICTRIENIAKAQAAEVVLDLKNQTAIAKDEYHLVFNSLCSFHKYIYQGESYQPYVHLRDLEVDKVIEVLLETYVAIALSIKESFTLAQEALTIASIEGEMPDDMSNVRLNMMIQEYIA